MRVLVTGGAGFIGSHLVDRLLAGGDAVDVIDDLSTGSLANLSDARASGSEFRFHHLDCTAVELDDVVRMRRPDIIYHLADHRGADARRTLDVVAGTTLSVLESAARHGVGKVVVAFDALELFGAVAASELPVRESAGITPASIRGLAQRAALDALAHYRRGLGVEYTALVVASVYGPRQLVGAPIEFVRAAVAGQAPTITGDGRQTRDFLFIDDAVDAFARAAQRGAGLVVNVGSGVQMAIRDLAQIVVAAAPNALHPVRVPARADEVVRFAVSPVRARIHLAWAPWTTLEDGIRQTLDWFSDQT